MGIAPTTRIFVERVLATQDALTAHTQAFAFAAYDGDFYFFTEVTTGSTISKVTYYDPTNPGVFTNITNAPIRIVGAGVSTCAPLPE